MKSFREFREHYRAAPKHVRDRARDLFDEEMRATYRRRDRAFAWLLVGQWVAALLLEFFVAPHVRGSTDHSGVLQVWYALIFGTEITLPVLLLTFLRPSSRITRHAVAVAQMSWSALFVHISGGRLESHLHVFGSLAFLAYYRDPWVLTTGILTTLAANGVTGVFWPTLVYGTAHPEWWRPLLHPVWVGFEAAILYRGIHENVIEMRILSLRQAELEALNADFEERVNERTRVLATSREQYRVLVETTRTVPFELDAAARRFSYIGPQIAELTHIPQERWTAPDFATVEMHAECRAKFGEDLERIARAGEGELEFRVVGADGRVRWIRLNGSLVMGSVSGDDLMDSLIPPYLRGVLQDVSEARQLESELRQAQKLESVGRLAAGVAHEINTPVQFVSDSIHFLRDAMLDLSTLLASYRELHDAARSGAAPAELVARLDREREEADVDYFVENAPRALDRSLEGLGRVTAIVRSMKEFAHPDQKEMTTVDLNRGIQSTLTIARNEYKYVADAVTEFADLPPVRCFPGDINQAVLNIVVNAAHAIADQVRGTERRGRILVRTSLDGDFAVIEISDTGGGIPEGIRERIFDPFFTTKEVGKGTGQGLSIARSIVVDKHGGDIRFETQSGQGTTFILRLPVLGRTAALQEAA